MAVVPRGDSRMPPRVVAIVQARLGSTRLPRKVLEDIRGATMLARTVRRLQAASELTEVTIATSTGVEDNQIAEEAARLGVRCSHGSELDVLERYERAADEFEADVIVRVTSDCPLIDPEVVSDTVRQFLIGDPVDYCSNILTRTFPRGLDTEVISRDALVRTTHEARRPAEREHVTPYIYGHPERFRLRSVENDEDWSELRWTVDVADDLALVREIYAAFAPAELFRWRDVLGLIRSRPELATWNAHVAQKPVS